MRAVAGTLNDDEQLPPLMALLEQRSNRPLERIRPTPRDHHHGNRRRVCGGGSKPAREIVDLAAGRELGALLLERCDPAFEVGDPRIAGDGARDRARVDALELELDAHPLGDRSPQALLAAKRPDLGGLGSQRPRGITQRRHGARV
jgi:hypothetical protein